MFKAEYIFVGLLVCGAIVFLVRRLRHPEDFSCSGCSGCQHADLCDKQGKKAAITPSSTPENSTHDYRSPR